MTSQIVLRDLGISFGGLRAVDDVSMDIKAGKVTAVIGPNGAGKSSLMNMVTGFLTPTDGTVEFKGDDVTSTAPWKRVELGMARTFQDLEVFQDLTVAENVALGYPTPVGGSLGGVLFRPRAYAHERELVRNAVVQLLTDVGLLEHADTPASQLSYGDQKLLVVARLMATGADTLLLDEPGAGLARGSLDHVGQLLTELAGEGRTIFFTDHNMHLVFGYSDFVYVLHHGQLVAAGTPSEIQANEEVVRIYLSGSSETEESK